MDTGICIRPAAASDIAELCKLYYEFHEFHASGVPDRLVSLGEQDGFDTTELRKALTEIISSPDAALFVADVDGQLVGLAEVYLRQDDPANSLRVYHNYGYVQSLLVQGQYRRIGLGSQLLTAAEAWARAKGAQEVRLETWEFPGGPQQFYEAQGYRTLRRTLVHEFRE